METIGQFSVIRQLRKFNENLNLWRIESNDGQQFDVLTIQQNQDYQNLLDRLLGNEILPLINHKTEGIQEIIEVGFDALSKNHFIVYESSDGFETNSHSTLSGLKSVIRGLNELKKQNRFGYLITTETLLTRNAKALLSFSGLFELFKHQGLLQAQFLAPEVIEGSRPNFQSDIYSVFKCFESLLNEGSDEILKEIFAKALSEKRTDRFSKYSEILAELDKVQSSAYSTDQGEKHKIRVVVKEEDKEHFLPTLMEMKSSCCFLLDRNLSEQKSQITGQFSTKNFSGRFFVDQEGYIFIPFQGVRNQANPKVTSQGFVTEYSYEFDPIPCLNCSRYFHEQWENLNTLAELNKTRHSLLKKWQTLPDQEKTFIEEKAFKAAFVEREESKSNSANIRFKLTNDFRNWEIFNELKHNNIDLFIDDKIIGKVQDYNPSDCFLVIKDAQVTIDEIPEKGELHQDVRVETSQFKKQVEACKKFEIKDVVNPDLCGILATPENVPVPKRVNIDYEGFKDEVINPYLKVDNTQRDAVLEALHYKPLYLIQGPPGTGKTTVIVELIQQIVKQNRHAKILVTSQSNLAVDNVLERIPKEILFMRLASSEERISSAMKSHSFQSKLKHWVKETQTNSEEFFQANFQEKTKDKAIIQFYNSYSTINKDSKEAFSDFTNQLRWQNQYVKKVFEKANTIKEVERIFNEILGKEFQQLKSIQKDWLAFLSNAETDEGNKKKSMLNDGSQEVDLQTAFVKSVNVIGATCIHIASGQYSEINFQFDHVIMDESSKATPAESLVPINIGRNIILIGDHKQLPPVVTREEAIKQKVRDALEDNGLDIEKEFGESLFEKLIVEFKVNPNLQRNIKMLDIQYRMPRQIGHLISSSFYEGALKNPEISTLPDFDEDKSHGLAFKQPLISIVNNIENRNVKVPNSIVFISTSNRINPHDNDNKFDRKNTTNKVVVEETLTQLNELYTDNSSQKIPFTIGVIAGYRGQVNLLRESIDLLQYKNFVLTNEDEKQESLIEINTVDKFQGAERDIIIYDIVKSSKGSSTIGFLDDYRRINVAFSRAKRLLIVIGDSEYILKRAALHPQGSFKEFKLKEIVSELDKQGAVVHNFKEILE